MLEALREALDVTANEPPEVKAAAASAATTKSVRAIGGPLSRDVGFLWKTLVVGLVAILLISLGGIIYTVVDGNNDTTPDVIVTVFSAALAGLLGLFVQSPQTG